MVQRLPKRFGLGSVTTLVKLGTGPLAPHSPGPVFELLFLSSTDTLVSILLPNYVAFSFRGSPIIFHMMDRGSPEYYTCYSLVNCSFWLRGIVIHITYVDLHRF
jgi:hypothetical protein